MWEASVGAKGLEGDKGEDIRMTCVVQWVGPRRPWG